MPQTITPRVHRTITLAANDLCTVNYTGDSDGGLFIRCCGPGIAWVSFDTTVPAAVGNVNCFMLRSGDTLTLAGLERGTIYTLNADTASTLLTLTNL
jgi:hypothetical protein